VISFVYFISAADGTRVAVNPAHVTALWEAEDNTTIIMLVGGDAAHVGLPLLAVEKFLVAASGELK
jgi:hypothetical protein